MTDAKWFNFLFHHFCKVKQKIISPISLKTFTQENPEYCGNMHILQDPCIRITK